MADSKIVDSKKQKNISKSVKNKVLAVVGLCGSGKSEVSKILQEKGLGYIRFGQVTMDEIRARGLEINEYNEKKVREELRERYGMAAYATLNLAKIESLLGKSSVVADGLYSWEEYIELEKKFGSDLILICIYTTRALRYERLSSRIERPLTRELAVSRDYAEITRSNKGGPIAIADYLVINDGSLEELKTKLNEILKRIF
jgi:dephospho-CoA kinase